jgi:hypothetical protein
MLSFGIVCVPGGLSAVKSVANKPGDIIKQVDQLNQAEILEYNILKTAELL